LSVVDVRSLT
jgi:hypothetical protein